MSRSRRAPREIITHGEGGRVPDHGPVEGVLCRRVGNGAQRGRTAALGPKNERTLSKAAAGL
ncbi:hypothetical protein [Streptomyces sp. NPDC004232]|uniref:hypothetical protein n=1 Tax=unclassified Streptomyces TaxID=2593676 RepID=UPI001DEA2851|nr:hypothetical protein [Streptomyces sp. tea 10]